MPRVNPASRTRKPRDRERQRAADQVDPKKRTRNDGRRVITRQRLVDATVDIVRAEGVAALTTGRIANAAGIQQPGFYAHFKNVDECVKEAAEQLTATMMDAELRTRREAGFTIEGTEELPKTIERMKWALGLWLENRRFAELMLRCRFDSSPIGESSRAAARRARATLTEDLLGIAVSMGISPRYLRDIELMAALITAAFANALELLLSPVAPDLDAVATALGRSQFHHAKGELERMQREQYGSSPVKRRTTVKPG